MKSPYEEFENLVFAVLKANGYQIEPLERSFDFKVMPNDLAPHPVIIEVTS